MDLSVVYSSDNHYTQHVGVSMISLFENNKHCKDIHVYLVENKISLQNKQKLNQICEKYNRSINFIDFHTFSQKLRLNIDDSISVNSYARLFLSSVLEHLDKVVYLDCDSVINDSLTDLWNIDISEYDVAGVSDTVNDDTKIKVNLRRNGHYINAGMLLINLKKWRTEEIESKFMNFIDSFGGNVFHHDQGTINGVLHNRILLLHPRYNAMTTFFTMSREEMITYYGLKNYYSDAELKEAIHNPVFIHYTPAFVNRPWIKGCKHPLAHLYREYLDMSPWKGVNLSEDQRGLVEKVIAYLYNNLPFRMANGICKLIPK